MVKIEEVRAALLRSLMTKRALENQLETVSKQIDGLENQLYVLEQLESTGQQDASTMKKGAKKEGSSGETG